MGTMACVKGGRAMKLRIWILFFLLLVFPMHQVIASPEYYAESLPRWQDMLKSGNAREKKLALHHLWFLSYGEYRKDIKVFDPILEALKDKDDSVREAAAACLKVIGGDIQKDVRQGYSSRNCCGNTAIVPSLVKALASDNNPHVRAEAAKALGMYRFDTDSNKGDRIVDPLIEALKDKNPWVRLCAAHSLGEYQAQKALEALIAQLDDHKDITMKFVQQECLASLKKNAPYLNRDQKERIKPILMRKSDDDYLREGVIKLLGVLRASEAKNLILTAANDPNEKVRKAALEALSHLPTSVSRGRSSAGLPKDSATKTVDPSIEIIARGLEDPSEQVRLQSVESLGRLRDSGAVEPLLAALNDKSERVRWQAAKMLAYFTDERVLDALIARLGTYSPAGPVEESLRAIAQRTCAKRVHIYRKNGVRYIVGSHKDIPADINVSADPWVHPVIVDKLIAAIGKNEERHVNGVLNFIIFFEDERIEPLLIQLLDHPSPNIRYTAIIRLNASATNQCVPKVIKILQDTNQRNGTRVEAANLLGRIRDQRSAEPLVQALNDPHDELKAAAIRALSHFDEPDLSDVMIAFLDAPSDRIRAAATSYFVRKPHHKAVDRLISLLNDKNDSVALSAVSALGASGDPRAVDPLISALSGALNRNRSLGRDRDLKWNAAVALGKIGGKKAVAALIDALDDPEVTTKCIVTLHALKEKAAIAALKKCLQSDNAYIRQLAAAALKDIEK